jgi:hypothetical protein
MSMESNQGQPQNKLENFIEKLNSDPEYWNKFIDDPAGFFGENVGPLPEPLRTQLNEYVKKKLEDISTKTLTFKVEDQRNIINIIVKILVG